MNTDTAHPTWAPAPEADPETIRLRHCAPRRCAGLDIALEIGAKALKGEMAW